MTEKKSKGLLAGNGFTINAILIISGLLLISVAMWHKFSINTSSSNEGEFTDQRDGKTYKFVKIGDQTWMAQNLNYTGSTKPIGSCYNNDASLCGVFGSLYTYWDMMNLPGANPYQGICPNGWRIPNDSDWTILVDNAGKENSRLNLSSGKIWNGSQAGLDSYGFAALPSGVRSSDGVFDELGKYGLFMSFSGQGMCCASAWIFDGSKSEVYPDKAWPRLFSGSLRCIKITEQ